MRTFFAPRYPDYPPGLRPLRLQRQYQTQDEDEGETGEEKLPPSPPPSPPLCPSHPLPSSHNHVLPLPRPQERGREPPGWNVEGGGGGEWGGVNGGWGGQSSVWTSEGGTPSTVMRGGG